MGLRYQPYAKDSAEKKFLEKMNESYQKKQN